MEEDTVIPGINGERCRVTFQSGPIHIGMISFEFRINQIFKTFSGDGIVVLFVPYSIVRSRNPVFPDTVRAAAHPFHAGAILFRIRESQTEIEYFGVHESIIESTSAGSSVQQNGIHIE